MRIAQLSDVHLSKKNMDELRNYFLDSLLDDLKTFHSIIPFDLIIFTGDLVDKGGNSLGDDPYQIFSDEIIKPILIALKMKKEQVIFIPGNHDIDRDLINEHSEYFLSNTLNKETANAELKKMKTDFNDVNKRIEPFKTFEKNYHLDTENYSYSNNESTFTIQDGEKKIGFVLVNDSWRCSSNLEQKNHFFGYSQLLNAKKMLALEDTNLNIALFHHPLDALNSSEREEVNNILKAKDFDLAIFGHSHRHRAEKVSSQDGGYLSLNARSAFGNPLEDSSLFQPGYNILDIDPVDRSYTIFARKFIRLDGFRFDKDTDSLTDGTETGTLPLKGNYFQLAENSNNKDNQLPDSYTADVHRIVNLLIGKSIYPNPYIFIRELIQNSVDACDRINQKQTQLSPKITININTEANYIEVLDEGDGMSKEVIKNHFSVIGKSISQEFNDNTGNFNLISKFGIGFISTFIAAEKVVISTKTSDDEQVSFEILDVFKGFQYISINQDEIIKDSGTRIRVYMKKEYNPQIALNQAQQYCRHIDNLDCFINSSRITLSDSWNIEGAVFQHLESNNKYELRMGISANARSIIASNSGFLISNNPMPLIPFKFPYIISGEVNFKPNGIDFDVSRSNILDTDKSQAFRREISILVRKFFRQILENGDLKTTPLVINYLQHYLQYFDTDYARMESNYSDFYSKKELINLCSDYTTVKYNGAYYKLSTVLTLLKSKCIKEIIMTMTESFSDYDIIVIKYLETKGYLITKNRNFNVQIRDASQTCSLFNVFQIIAADNGMSVLDISNIPQEMLVHMKIDRGQFPEKLQTHLTIIEKDHNINIHIGKFGSSTKPSVTNGSQLFLNHDHEAFQSILENIENFEDQVFKMYLLGILGLKL